MAAEAIKLTSGYDMPVIGLGTWLVCIIFFVLCNGKKQYHHTPHPFNGPFPGLPR